MTPLLTAAGTGAEVWSVGTETATAAQSTNLVSDCESVDTDLTDAGKGEGRGANEGAAAVAELGGRIKYPAANEAPISDKPPASCSASVLLELDAITNATQTKKNCAHSTHLSTRPMHENQGNRIKTSGGNINNQKIDA